MALLEPMFTLSEMKLQYVYRDTMRAVTGHCVFPLPTVKITDVNEHTEEV